MADHDSSDAREHLLPVDGGRLFVRAIGTGLTMIVVHGGPDFDHAYFLPELDRLAASTRLVYYDQRGRGRSFNGEGPDDVTIGDDVEDLDRIREWTGSSTVAVIGHSWGCVLAAEYAIRHPDRVSHLVLMSPAPVSRSHLLVLRRDLSAMRAPGDAERMAELADDPGYLAGDLDIDAAYYRIHFAPTLPDPAALDEMVGRLRTASTPEGIVAARAIEDGLYAETWLRETYDLLPGLRSVPAPTLIIHGERDFIPLEIAEDIADAVPDARLEVIPDAGHFAFFEQPDRVTSMIERFLAST